MYWNAPVFAHITDLPNTFTVEPQLFSLSANISDALALPTFQLTMSSPSQNTTEPLPIYHNSPSTNTTPQCYWATCFGINTSLEISLLCGVCHSFLDKKEPGEFSSWTYFRAIFLFLDTSNYYSGAEFPRLCSNRFSSKARCHFNDSLCFERTMFTYAAATNALITTQTTV